MISIVVPFYNEHESVRELHGLIANVMKKLGKPFEVIFIDDGSTDGTFEEIKKCVPIRGLRMARNSGQTAAFGCGIGEAKGDIIVTMDGDLENQPEDIPWILKKLDEGYDCVSGWREKRWHQQLFTRRIPSLLANRLISRVTGVELHDHGCNLRAYRKEIFRGVDFNGEMHRMLAAYLGMRGAHVAEIPVSYVSRKFGQSKYGLSRTFKVILDVLAFYFFKEYGTRPMHFFGYAGFVSIGLGFLTFFWAFWLRVFEELHFNRTPLPIVVAIFVVVGFQFILMGLLAEMFFRSRAASGGKREYDIRERIER